MNWINVEDELPDIDCPVLTWQVWEETVICGNLFLTKEGEKLWAIADADKCIGTAEQLGITHWMPLPEGPDE